MPPMPPRPYMLSELTWKTVRDARYEVAVLPWGATEAHNLHLPYTTDNIETERIAALAAGHAWERGARVVVLPLLPFGVNTGQLDIPLCLNLNPSTQALVLRDLAATLAGQGVPKLVMLHIAPELVRPLSEAGPGRARRFTIAALREGWAWAPRRWREVTDDTGVGNPAAATAEKGRKYVAAVSEKIGTFLAELAQADPAKLYE